MASPCMCIHVDALLKWEGKGVKWAQGVEPIYQLEWCPLGRGVDGSIVGELCNGEVVFTLLDIVLDEHL